MSVKLKHKVLGNKDRFEFNPVRIVRETEGELWRAFKGGCKASFAFIYKNHFFNLYQYGLKKGYPRELVKDSIQDLFVELWKYRENLKDTDNIGFYLAGSFRNKLSNQVRETGAAGVSLGTLSTSVLPGEGSVEEKLIEEQTMLHHKKKVLQAINLLSGRQQQAIRLKYFQNLKNEEIASQMAISVPSVYNLVSKAIASLRKNLNTIYVLVLLYIFL